MATNAEPIRIRIGRQADGYAFRLEDQFRNEVQEDARRLGTVFIGFDTLSDLETYHGPIWTHVAELLTGLSPDALKTRGAVFVEGTTGAVVHRYSAA